MKLSSCVISTRVRLARNYADLPFPNRMNDVQASEAIRRTMDAVGKSACGREMNLRRMADIGDLERRTLVERHLISNELANNAESAVLMNKAQTLSVMINEEDHLRIQAILPGLCLKEAMAQAEKIDNAIALTEKIAFHEKLGYLTACPTNTGTGMRASVMLHLPAITLAGQADAISAAMSRLGLTVRGFYGEGTQAQGSLYQLSNQVTLGKTEEDILSFMDSAAKEMLTREEEMRENLLSAERGKLEDRLMRSYGILLYARRLSTGEFMRLSSDVLLALDLGFIQGVDAHVLHALQTNVQPAMLTLRVGHNLGSEERDEKRADLVRQTLQE